VESGTRDGDGRSMQGFWCARRFGQNLKFSRGEWPSRSQDSV